VFFFFFEFFRVYSDFFLDKDKLGQIFRWFGVRAAGVVAVLFQNFTPDLKLKTAQREHASRRALQARYADEGRSK
jgi:hypothetical protein